MVPDGELKVPGDDADLRGEVLHHGGHVDGGAGAHPLGVVALPAHELFNSLELILHEPEEPMDPANGELEAGPAGAGLGLALHLASLTTSRHRDG